MSEKSARSPDALRHQLRHAMLAHNFGRGVRFCSDFPKKLGKSWKFIILRCFTMKIDQILWKINEKVWIFKLSFWGNLGGISSTPQVMCESTPSGNPQWRLHQLRLHIPLPRCYMLRTPERCLLSIAIPAPRTFFDSGANWTPTKHGSQHV